MTKFYTYAKTYGNQILYRGYENGKKIIERVDFQPTLFVPSKTDKKNGWHSLMDGKSLDPVEFDSIKDAKRYIEEYNGVHGIEVHGFQRFEYQYINKNFPKKIERDLKDVNILFLDIECVDETEQGFPDIQAARTPIVLISLHSTIDNKTIVMGTKPYELQPDDDFEYELYADEKALLKRFIEYNVKTRPDVWSGWNTSQFDIPYIVNRIKLLFNDAMVKKLSPFGLIREKTLNIRGRDVQTYDIYGVVDLDYLELYKKFGTYSAKESYALGFIAQEELGESKLELPGNSFVDAYMNYFPTFVQYNAKDTVLVKRMDAKKNLIRLAFNMAYMYHCNLQDIYKTVLPWEVFIFNYLAERKIAVPPRTLNPRGNVEGAWVKQPNPGMYGWSIAFDYSSLYPSVMRQWNISPETFIPAAFSVDVASIMDMKEGDTASKALDYAYANNLTIAANGTMYRKDKQGFLAELMEYCMEGRTIARKEMERLKAEYQKTGDESLLPRIASLNDEQMALKIAANSCYGAIGNEGFHYYDYRMAEAITLTGQLANRDLANRMNAKMNKIMATEGIDYIIYGDTDSIYLDCESLVQKYMAGKPREDVVSFLDAFGEDVCQPVINKTVKRLYELTNAYDLVMASKREAISSRALFRGKKNYAMYVLMNEDVVYKEPELKVMGIEIVRSSTPQWCRKRLKEMLMMIFETDEKTFREKFAELEKEFYTLPPEEVAFPRGVSDVDKYIVNGKLKAGMVPIHVRAAVMYNLSTKGLNLPPIQNGDKIKYLYLKMPNPLNSHVFGFPTGTTIPKELGLTKYVDYDLQFEKSMETPLQSLTDCANWQLRAVASLSSFFE